MDNFYAVYIGMHWVAVFFYILASVSNIAGVIFNKQKAEKSGYLILAIGLLIHGAAILAGWIKVGHGPYISAHEALSSFSCIADHAPPSFLRLRRMCGSSDRFSSIGPRG